MLIQHCNLCWLVQSDLLFGDGGILFLSSSGIWQTVWLEAVPSSYVTRVDLTPDLETPAISVTVHAVTPGNSSLVSATIIDQDNQTVVGASYGLVGNVFDVHFSGSATLWTPETPYLYDVRVQLLNLTIGDVKVRLALPAQPSSMCGPCYLFKHDHTAQSIIHSIEAACLCQMAWIETSSRNFDDSG